MDIEAMKAHIAEELRKENEITEKSRNKISSDVTKIVFLTNKICFGPEPDTGDEVEQKLTISHNGTVYLTHRYYNSGEDYDSKSERINIGKDNTIRIFDKCLLEFIDFNEPAWLDCGSWSMEIHFTDGLTLKRGCSFGNEPRNFSKFLRKIIGKTDIFALGR